MNLYTTNPWKGFGKQNYYYNQYRLEGDKVVKYYCHRQRVFNGKGSEWQIEETAVDSWNVNDVNMPEWLKGYVANAL